MERTSMRPVLARLPIALAIALTAATAAAAARDFAYLSPLPGSQRVSPGNNIAIRPGSPLEPASVAAAQLTVTGSRSGAHAGRLRLASDGRTIVFRPDQPFAANETVRVRLASGVRTSAGSGLPGLDYTFQVSAVDPRAMPRPEPERLPDPPEPSVWWREPMPSAVTAVGACDTLLPGFPPLTLVNTSAQLPGVYFMAPFDNSNQTIARLQILDDRGKPIFQRQFSGPFRPTDFKVQPDGRLTFFLSGNEKYYAMDSAYAVV